MNHGRRRFLEAAACGVAGAPLAFMSAQPGQRAASFLSEFGPAWRRSHLYTLEVAEAMPEVDYDFRPIPEVYSFAEHLIHIEITTRGFLALVRGDGPQAVIAPTRDGKRKREIVDALDRAFLVVQEEVRTVTDEVLDQMVPWGGRLYDLTEMSKRQVFGVMRNHLTHHRAQAVLQLRLRGVQPPGYVD